MNMNYINKMSNVNGNGNKGVYDYYYINSKCEKLKTMKGKIEEINKKFKENINKFNKNLESLINMLNNYILSLELIIRNNPDSNNIYMQNQYDEDIRKEIKKFLDSLISISYSNNFNILDSKNELDKLLKEIISFDFSPYDKNNEVKLDLGLNNDSHISQELDDQNINQSRREFINGVNEVGGGSETYKYKTYNESIDNKCFSCKLKKPNCFFLNKMYCKECINEKISKMYDEGEAPNLDNIIYFIDKKEIFMNSLETFIKIILLKINFILNNKSKISINIENHKRRDIERKFNYPIIRSNEYKDSDLNFMKDINSVLINDFNPDFQDFSEKNFNLINLNENIRELVKNIFNIDDKINNDDEINNINNNLKMIEENNFVNNIDYYNSYDFNPKDLKNEHYVKDNKDKDIKMNNKTLEDYYLLINLISNKKESFKRNINCENEIIKSLNDIPNKDSILFSYNRTYFLDEIIRNEKFNDLSFKEVKNKYQNLDELCEFKNIIEELLIRQCQIDKKLIDYKGHFIIPNKSNNFIRGKEKYYPPYNWIGIGLKVLGKYDDDDWIIDSSKESKWSIAYHGVGGNLPSSEVIKKLTKKIINGLKDGESQYKCSYSDIRHKNKRIGTGVYLTPNINICENYAGQIFFNKSKYKIALMVKVLNDKIREPEDINFWIVNKKYIRTYRILFKKVME